MMMNLKRQRWNSREEKLSQALFYNSETLLIQILSGGDREGEIPEPIPNSEVKLFLADGTVRKSTVE